MVEIKKELKQENMAIKSNAIAKLIYVSDVSCLAGRQGRGREGGGRGGERGEEGWRRRRGRKGGRCLSMP